MLILYKIYTNVKIYHNTVLFYFTVLINTKEYRLIITKKTLLYKYK